MLDLYWTKWHWGQFFSSASYYINAPYSSMAGTTSPLREQGHFYSLDIPFICMAIHTAADITQSHVLDLFFVANYLIPANLTSF
jgi:hypothetical protein